MALKTVRTSCLDLAFYEHGPPSGWPVVLTHGFPYDARAYDRVVPTLVDAGARVLVPYVRGYGPTRFHSPSIMRSGQQAALAKDLIELLDANGIDRAIVAGFDWGGVASCAAAILFPERVSGLVSYAGYDIMDIEAQREPGPPTMECLIWYQHLFQHARGKECLRRSRRDLCYKLWEQWSPSWAEKADVFRRIQSSFDNPDFVDVVVHAYRFMFGNEPGDPLLQHLEDKIAQKPAISVPAITLDGLQDPLKPGGSSSHDRFFASRHERRESNVGHAFPLEDPAAFADAIISVHTWAQTDEP